MDGQSSQQYRELSTTAVLQELKSDKKGLSPAEAQRRLRQSDDTSLQPQGILWFMQGLWHYGTGGSLLALFIGACATVLAGESALAIPIAAVLLWQLFLSLGAVARSRRFLAELAQSLNTTTTVIRSGKRIQIEANELVVGDIVVLEAGDTVPADVRLIETKRLALDEQALPQKVAAAKSAKANANNLAFHGSRVAGGTGTGVVFALGKHTALGSTIASVEKSVAYSNQPVQQLLRATDKVTAKLGLGLLVALILYAAFTDAPSYQLFQCIAILSVAIVPTTLPMLLTYLQQSGISIMQMATRTIWSDLAAKVSLAILAIIGYLSFHIPPAITVMGLLLFDVVAQLFPLAALRWDKTKTHRADPLVPISFGLVAGSLTYITFLLFFRQNGVVPRYLDAGNIMYLQATTLALITLVFCQGINLLFVRSDEHRNFFNQHLLSNKKLLASFGAALVCLGIIIYNPLLQTYLHTEALSLGDWLIALTAAMVYFAIRLLQRHDYHHHSRHALLRDHDHDTLRKHPKLAKR